MVKRQLTCLAVICLCALPFGGSQANAQASAQASHEVRLEVNASIPVRCGFAAAGMRPDAFKAMAIGSARTTELPLDCNTPFTIAVTSDQGGLVPQDITAQSRAMGEQEGFATKLDYGVALSLPVLDIASGGTPRIVSTACLSAADLFSRACDLSAGSGLSVQAITSGQPGALTVTLLSSAKKPVAGTYSDIIHITIEPVS
jgi:hypothetical protein